MTKKEKKRTYVKPQIQVVEWNFNEEVCNNISNVSGCVQVDDSTGSDSRADYVPTHKKGYLDNEWLGSWGKR